MESQVCATFSTSHTLGMFGLMVSSVAALTATAAGKKTFEKLGFKPTGYREVFMERASRGSHVNVDEGKPRVEMICLYPGDELPREVYARGEDGDTPVSVSEMTVKYLS